MCFDEHVLKFHLFLGFGTYQYDSVFRIAHFSRRSPDRKGAATLGPKFFFNLVSAITRRTMVEMTRFLCQNAAFFTRILNPMSKRPIMKYKKTKFPPGGKLQCQSLSIFDQIYQKSLKTTPKMLKKSNISSRGKLQCRSFMIFS